MRELNKAEILRLLTTKSGNELDMLWQSANEIVETKIQNKIYIRALVEIGNVCEKNCLYCGLRKGNKHLERYRMPMEEITAYAINLDKLGYGTIILQSGEDFGYTADDIANLIVNIKQKTQLAVTLSLGERDISELELWKRCGANRYFLRFETSNIELLKKIHPYRKNTRNSTVHPRLELLKVIQSLGYEVGTGFMIGIPGQSYDDLANDLLCLKEMDIDMVGMGPFIPHPLTPLAKLVSSPQNPFQVLPTPDMTYRCIAIARLLCPLANIPATTALCVLDKDGLRHGLSRGANVFMHDITPEKYRKFYEIYPGKTTLSPPHLSALHILVHSIGKNVGNGQGTSKNFICKVAKA